MKKSRMSSAESMYVGEDCKIESGGICSWNLQSTLVT